MSSDSADPTADSLPLQSGASALADLAQRERFLDAVAQAVADGSARRVLLSKPVAKGDDLERVTARPIALRGERVLSFVFRHRTKDITKNEPVDAALATIAELVGTRFAHAHLFARDAELQLMMSRKGRFTLHRSKPDAVDATRPAVAAASDDEPASHDRQKQRYVSLEAPFLVELGVTTARHELVPTMARKWKQINKFVEVMSHALESAGVGLTAPLNIVDFGAGKGYLTFALHDWLRRQAAGAPRALDVVGVELRPDLV
ncbi:MAG TPA: methyltransferase, partial [Burkholderiaceae bacterium]